ncbi:MAG: hypothetical protein V1740_05670 [Candidatus Woesearchaeota archaeon]
MVEIGLRKDNPELKAQLEAKLESLVKEHTFKELGKDVFRGFPAQYLDDAALVRQRVRRENGIDSEFLKRHRGRHWHPDFKMVIAKTLGNHNEIFANKIYEKLVEHTSDGRPVIYVTPVGPMGHYPVLAKLMNEKGRKDGLRPELIHTFAMDEWCNPDGVVLSSKEFPYMGSFKNDMEEQFYSLLEAGAMIPVKNRSFAAGNGLRDYQGKMENIMKKGAGVIFTGGVGMIGHIMFWEPNYGVLFRKEISEQVTYIRGAPLTTQTIAQNMFTSAASGEVPSFANTIGLGLFCMLRDYGLKTGRMDAFFGLDNFESPLIWQRGIARATLAMDKADPSMASTYPATVPGCYIIAAPHLAEQGFKVPSK